jgi:hypothetical protein
MHERKRGTLRSGGSGKRVTSRKQAIAIGLSEARREGGKVPSLRSGGGKQEEVNDSGFKVCDAMTAQPACRVENDRGAIPVVDDFDGLRP